MTSYEIYSKLREAREISDFSVSKETKIAPSTLSDWKNGKSEPKIDKMQTIAKFFGVSLEYLMTGKETTIVEDDFLSTLTPQEREEITHLYQLYQKADSAHKLAVEALLRDSPQESEYQKS